MLLLPVLIPPPHHFYPRSPCGERPKTAGISPPKRPFLSTLSLRRATTALSAMRTGAMYFYPRSPCGERRVRGQQVLMEMEFLSTLSLRRATVDTMKDEKDEGISIHALLAESDDALITYAAALVTFLSTLSLRRATMGGGYHRQQCQHFYPRSPCGERPDPEERLGIHRLFLSTLSLRRATLAQRDGGVLRAFLSTLSLRRATMLVPQTLAVIRYFYPRSPCGERLSFICLRVDFFPISIHALLAESDHGWWIPSSTMPTFLSTLSLRRATLSSVSSSQAFHISIHALLAESDSALHIS